MWRDKNVGDAYLEPQNALFRMDSRGPEIFGSDFVSRNPKNLSIEAHVGGTRDDGFVSFGESPELIVPRQSPTLIRK